eukprot:scaffold60122_cov36-Prasinocladus_malaysianus.AAC.1
MNGSIIPVLRLFFRPQPLQMRAEGQAGQRCRLGVEYMAASRQFDCGPTREPDKATGSRAKTISVFILAQGKDRLESNVAC